MYQLSLPHHYHPPNGHSPASLTMSIHNGVSLYFSSSSNHSWLIITHMFTAWCTFSFIPVPFIKVYGGAEFKRHSFLTSALDEGEWLGSRFDPLLSRKNPRYPSYRSLRNGLDTSKRRNISCYCWEFNPLNAELNPTRHLLVLVGARHIVHVSRIRVNQVSSVVQPVAWSL